MEQTTNVIKPAGAAAELNELGADMTENEVVDLAIKAGFPVHKLLSGRMIIAGHSTRRFVALVNLAVANANKSMREALEAMTRREPCDCGCPGGSKPVLLKPAHYYALACEALGVGFAEGRDDGGTGRAHCPMTKPSEQRCGNVKAEPTPNVVINRQMEITA